MPNNESEVTVSTLCELQVKEMKPWMDELDTGAFAALDYFLV